MPIEAGLHPVVARVLGRVSARSADTRRVYLAKVGQAAAVAPALSCGNAAHACAACSPGEKKILLAGDSPNIGIVTAYNDMLSAHQPFAEFPAWIKAAAARCRATAQVAGGVPAMCDGVTQGQVGMELSLFSRDVIAMAAAVALSHNTFAGAMFLGVCDKIVPGLVIAAASFGHLPAIFAPAGPMPSGLDNKEKARVREEFAAGRVGREELLAAEMASYHSPGTCTFYGTANTNQMMLEVMGLQLPGTSFVNPGTDLRRALTDAAVAALCENARRRRRVADVLSPAAFVNAMVGVLASGGSTNHVLHLPVMARACGVRIGWEDFAELSECVPLLCRLYPNGRADVNHFHAAGGMAFFVRELLEAGLLCGEVRTVAEGVGLEGGLGVYAREAGMAADGTVVWREGVGRSLDEDVVRGVRAPFAATGGLKVVTGNLGRGVVKVSAVPEGIARVCAPARVFDSQAAVVAAFAAGEMDGDGVCVVRFQGARANGMPELHKLTPLLSGLQKTGRAVALVTDGRMSGASGAVPAAIHVSPEAAAGGALARVRDGDVICLDWAAGVLEVRVDEAEWARREAVVGELGANASGCGRELFGWMRRGAGAADAAESVLFCEEEEGG